MSRKTKRFISDVHYNLYKQTEGCRSKIQRESGFLPLLANQLLPSIIYHSSENASLDSVIYIHILLRSRITCYTARSEIVESNSAIAHMLLS